MRATTLLALSALLVACVARPTGDFGRAEPDIVHDTMMPFAGDRIATLRGEPVSGFNQTDQEKQMHDRVWRFLIAPHAKDWLFDTSVELQRTRIVPPKDARYRTDRYYGWLKSTHYQSSRTRYSTVGANITTDIDTLPTTFAAICAVIDVAARKYENDAFIAWFVRALNYRFESYDFALDSLVVETPHEQSLGVDDALQRMSAFVIRANRRDFCGDGYAQQGRGSVVIPSRFQHSGDTEIIQIK